jgi:hypothetical protein
VSICNQGLRDGINSDFEIRITAQARAKGKLLLRKLGSFGDVWMDAFEPGQNEYCDIRNMLGCAIEIADAITKDRLSTIEESVSADVLGDLVEHAEVLMEQSFHLAAAVVLRAVLEERLRKLCASHGLAVTATRPTMENYKQALATGGIVNKIVAKKIDWMAGVGNAAAHNLPTFNSNDVPDLYKSTLDFLEKFTVSFAS